MSAAGTAGVSLAKTYASIGIVLAVVGGPALAISGTGFVAKSVGTGTGAAVGSVPALTSSFQDAMKQTRAKATPAPAPKAPKALAAK